MELTKEEKALAYEAYQSCDGDFKTSLYEGALAVLEARAASAVDQGLRKAAQDFVNKLEMVEPAINGAFAFQAIHGANYDGPNYGEELNALKAALTRQDGPVIGEEQPPYKKCGKVAQTFIAREGSFFPCALEEGHEGPCLQSGTCFRHGIYFGKNCPHWPKCADQLLAPRREPSHPMSGTMQDEVRVTDRPQEPSQQEADPFCSHAKRFMCATGWKCSECGDLKPFKEKAPASVQPPISDDVVERMYVAYKAGRENTGGYREAMTAALAVARANWHSWESVEKAFRDMLANRKFPTDCYIADTFLRDMRARLEAEPADAKSLSDLLCPPHAGLDKNGKLEPFDNCIACISNERDELKVLLLRISTDCAQTALEDPIGYKENRVYLSAPVLEEIGWRSAEYAKAEPAERVTVLPYSVGDSFMGWIVQKDRTTVTEVLRENTAKWVAAGLRAKLDAQGGKHGR